MPSRFALTFAALIFLAVAVGVPTYEVLGGVWPGKGVEGPFSADAIRKGQFAQAVEHQLERNERLPTLVRGKYNEAMFTLFHQATDQVVVGRHGWIFLGAATRGYPAPDERKALPRSAELIASVVRWLESKGTTVFLLLAPEKSSLLPDEVPPQFPPFHPMYDESIAALRAEGLDVLDPRPVLFENGEPLYFKADTHWTSEGALASAHLLADHIRAHYGGADQVPGVPVDGEVLVSPLVPHKGDLLAMLGFDKGGWLERRYTAMRVVARGADPTTRATLDFKEPEEVMLAGTSFSYGYQLPNIMSALLHRRVEHRAIIGKGPVFPLIEPLQEVLKGKRPLPRLLIWEIPERYLFLSAGRDLRPPLENLLRAMYYDGSSERPLDSRTGSKADLELTKIGEGGFEAVASSNNPRFELDLDHALPGDGSLALVFELSAPIPSQTRVYFDTGAGFSPKDKVEVTQIGFDAEQLMVIPLKTDGDAPIRRIRVDPINVKTTLRVGRMRLWSKAPR